MALTDLKKYAGLALAFDGNDLIPQESGVDIAGKEIVRISDVRPQILNPELSCPSIFYYIFNKIDRKSLFKRKRLRLDLYIIPPNLAGIEYVKTKGISAGNFPVLIDVAYGFALVVIQSKFPEGPDGKIKCSSIKLKKGEKFVVPPAHNFALVNSRQSLSAVSVIFSNKARIKSVFDETRGACSYVIRKNARMEVVLNPSYREIEPVKPWKPEDLYSDFNLTAKTPVFKQILRKYDRFKWLHNPSEIDWDNLPGCH